MVRKNKGQSVQEFAILLAVVTAALLAMQIYIKRGVQGRLKDLAGQISTQHYDPATTTSNYTVTRSSTQEETFRRGSFTSDINETIIRSGWQRTVEE